MAHLTSKQRYTISVMINQGFNQTMIAKTIGKDKSVVCRELKRNCDQRNDEYRPELAQKKYTQRQKHKNKHVNFTQEIKEFVTGLIEQDFSPEQIAGRAKLLGFPCVSHEAIYQLVWIDKRMGGDLFTHLRRKGRRYRKRGNTKDSRGIIKDRVDISQRPKIVEKKLRIGDLETDTIIGKNHKGALLTINDRVSSFVWIQKLDTKQATTLALKAIDRMLCWKDKIHTITSDNGKEFAQHKLIADKLGVDFYFAKPYHAWQRGANENINGLIRQYFPKQTSFENLNDQQIEHVQHKLNNRPRKKLGFLTPNEFLIRKFVNQKLHL